MRRTVYIILMIGIWVTLTVVGITWGSTYDWPDFVHVDHGVPLVWGTHTLNTIAGPVDKWRVDLWTLTIDLAIWLGTMVAVVAVLLSRAKNA